MVSADQNLDQLPDRTFELRDDSVTHPSGPEPLPVRVVRSSRRTKSTAARIKDGYIEVRIPAWLSKDAEDEAVSTLVARLERRRRIAAQPVDLDSRAQTLAEHYDLPLPRSIAWSERQTTLWGSCTPAKGTIRISSRLANAPGWVIDYVVLHELTHLVVADHGPRFQQLMDRYPRAERAEGFLEAMSLGLAEPKFTDAQ